MTELLFRDDAYLKTATARVVAAQDGVVTLDRTIFYPLGGGQPGDTGVIIRDNGERLTVADTRKGQEPGTVAHHLAAGSALPESGEAVGLEIDWDRRYALMRLHTALHVMSCGGVPTETVWITDEELDARPELVKTMSVQPPRGAGHVRLLKIPDIDLQPCGGTHVANIAEIGGIRVLRIRNEGKRNKRVEIALKG
jgi:misacylated tRNA(Ala) deacylase